MLQEQFDQVLKRLLCNVDKGPMYVLLEKRLISRRNICEEIAMRLWLYADETLFSDSVKGDIQILKQQLEYLNGHPGHFVFN